LVIALTALPLTAQAQKQKPALPVQDPAALQELQEELEHFQFAARDYRATVNHVIKREYQERRRTLAEKYQTQANVEEKAVRERRLQAIAMHEAFLAKYPNDDRWSPDVIFRLAELYFEKSEDEFLAAQDEYDRAQAAGKGDATPPPDRPDYSRTIELYKRLIAQFPNYRLLDGAEYLMGYCYGEMNQKNESQQAYLSLVCANRYKPLEPYKPISVPAPQRGPGGIVVRGAASDPYHDCKPARPDSKFLAEAWARLGEYHFAANELQLAIATFSRVLAYKDSPLFDKALYKLAWSYYRDDRFPEAIQRFDELVKWSDEHADADKEKGGSKLRPEAVQYLGISFAEEDWDGDHRPDPETGLQRIEKFYAGREKEKHVREIFRRLGDIYFDQTKYDEAVRVYQVVLAKWPNDPDGPQLQAQIVKAYDRKQDFKNAMTAREALARNFGVGSTWAKSNADNPEAINGARTLAEQSLADAAIYHHQRAQQLKAEFRDTKDKNLLPEIKKEYALAGELYQKYLERYPNSKEAYEQRWNFAEDLYYGENYAAAAVEYSKIRDSNLNDTHREEAAFGAIKSLEKLVEVEVAAKRIEDPPLPDAKNTTPPIQPKPIPQPIKDLQVAYDWYSTHVKNDKVSEVAYTSAVYSFKYLNWDGEGGARSRMADIVEKHCKSAEGPKANNAVVAMYTIERNLEKLEEWVAAHKDSQCGSGSVISTINDLKFEKATKLLEQGNCEEAGPIFLELANQYQSDVNADKALNNAAVCFEKVHRYGEATRAYEQLHERYPNSKLDEEALYRAAVNHERFFQYGEAVSRYLALATSPKYAGSAHRTESLGKAAVLLENDQQYSRAADLYKQYAATVGKPDEAATSYFRSAVMYEKLKDRNRERQTLRDFINKYGAQRSPSISANIVQAHFKLGEIAEAEHDKPNAEREYDKVISEFAARGLPAGSEAAEQAAKADFGRAEKKFAAFKAMAFKAGNAKQIQRSYETMEGQAKQLVAEYEKIWSYKRAAWTLAAFERKGDIYFEFSQKLARSEVPEEVKKLDKKNKGMGVIEQYRQQLETRVDPIEKQAQEYWKTTLDKGAELGVANDWTQLARKNLNAYQPDQFPLTKEARVELEQEDLR
jgi:TolA-binding protein